MSCPTGCRRPTPAQAHCSVCHRTFGGVRAFDRHRSKGTCVDPALLGYIERGGVWREDISDAKRGRLSTLRNGTPADHPHTDPGDGRSECERCGKWVWPVTHSCKGVPVTEAARARVPAGGA